MCISFLSTLLQSLQDVIAFPNEQNYHKCKIINPKCIKINFNSPHPIFISIVDPNHILHTSPLSSFTILQMVQPSDAYLQQQIMLEQTLYQDSSYEWYIIGLIIAVILGYLVYIKHFSKERLHAVKTRLVPQTRSEQIIVAWEIDGLLVELSDRKRQGFSRLEVQTEGIKYAYEKVKELFGMGIFYKAKMSVKNIRSILQSLADNPKVKLFLYTTLDLKVAQLILEKLCLLNFFGVENRRSCSDRYCEPLKHPTEVDYNTKRVIILTGSCSDHLQEDSKYFLVIKKKELGTSVKVLSKIIAKNRDVDDLHNQLGELKAIIESDYENNE